LKWALTLTPLKEAKEKLTRFHNNHNEDCPFFSLACFRNGMVCTEYLPFFCSDMPRLNIRTEKEELDFLSRYHHAI
jgi:hypothetical protein